MHDAERHDLIQCLTAERTAVGPGSHREGDQDLSGLIVAALLAASSGDLLADALQLATVTADRQLVAIATAYRAGEHDRVVALGGDHLVDHCATPVLAWIVARSRAAMADRGDRPSLSSTANSTDERPRP